MANGIVELEYNVSESYVSLVTRFVLAIRKTGLIKFGEDYLPIVRDKDGVEVGCFCEIQGNKYVVNFLSWLTNHPFSRKHGCYHDVDITVTADHKLKVE